MCAWVVGNFTYRVGLQWVKRAVALAVDQMSLALQSASDSTVDDLNDLPPMMGPLTRLNSGNRSKSRAVDNKKILEIVVNLIHLLAGNNTAYVCILRWNSGSVMSWKLTLSTSICNDLSRTVAFIQRTNHGENARRSSWSGLVPSPPGVVSEQSFAPVDESSVLCASAITNLADNPCCRARLVSNGVLPLVRHWLRWILDEASAATEVTESMPSPEPAAQTPDQSTLTTHV